MIDRANNSLPLNVLKMWLPISAGKVKFLEVLKMYVSGDLMKISVTQAALAEALELSRPRINQLINEGVVVRADDGGVLLVESCRNYWDMKERRERVDYAKERALHEAADRKMAELKLAIMEGRAFHARTVELVMIEQLSNLRAKLLGLPAKLAPTFEQMPEKQIEKILQEEISDILQELQEYRPELFTNEEYTDMEQEQ